MMNNNSLVQQLFLGVLFFSGTAIVLADTCQPTSQMGRGTHYKPITEQKLDIGTGFKVRGRILSAENCQPIANARVEHWQAGENGRYQDRLRAYRLSGPDGRYDFETEWPAAAVPHIHFIVKAEGYKPLQTQWVGDERTPSIQFDMVLEKD